MLFLIILSLLTIWIIARQNRNILARRIAYVFLSLWTFALTLSTFNPQHLYPVRIEIYVMLLAFVCFLILGITVVDNGKTRGTYAIQSDKIKTMIESLALNKKTLVYVFLCDLFMYYLFKLQEVMLLSMSALELRAEGKDFLYQGNSFLGLTNNFPVAPISVFVCVFFSYILVFKRNKVIPLVIYGTYILLSTYIGGARGYILKIFVYIVFFIICCPFLMKGMSMWKMIKQQSVILLFALFSLIFVSYMTNQRLANDNNFTVENAEAGWETTSTHFVTYFVGPFRALDYGMNHNYVEQMGGYKYGLSTLGCLDQLVETVLNRVGIQYENANKSVYEILQNKWIMIPHNFNFAYTAVFNFYVDFGYLGIIIIPFLLGGLLKKMIGSFYRTSNPFMFILIIYFYTVLFDAYFSWRLYLMTALTPLIWIFILKKIYDNYMSHPKAKLSK